MKYLDGHKPFAGVIVAVFVVLVGALGYTYVVNMNAEVAKTHDTTEQKLVAPQIATTSDLDKATEVLDSATLDEDLAELEVLDDQL